jgi:hypothetical protein
MFQSSKQRVTAKDQPICIDCIHDQDCTFKPDLPGGWRFVLDYCQRFAPKEVAAGEEQANVGPVLPEHS